MQRVLALFSLMVGIALLWQQGYPFLVPVPAAAEAAHFKDVSRAAGTVDSRAASLDMAVGQPRCRICWLFCMR